MALLLGFIVISANGTILTLVNPVSARNQIRHLELDSGDSVEGTNRNRTIMPLVLIMIDTLAQRLGSLATVDTQHDDDCTLAVKSSSSLKQMHTSSLSQEDWEEFFNCDCNMFLEAVLTETQTPENTLLLSTSLERLIRQMPWLRNGDQVSALLQFATAEGMENQFLPCINPKDFDEAMGHFFTQMDVSPKMCTTKSHLPMYGMKN